MKTKKVTLTSTRSLLLLSSLLSICALAQAGSNGSTFKSVETIEQSKEVGTGNGKVKKEKKKKRSKSRSRKEKSSRKITETTQHAPRSTVAFATQKTTPDKCSCNKPRPPKQPTARQEKPVRLIAKRSPFQHDEQPLATFIDTTTDKKDRCSCNKPRPPRTTTK